MNNLLTNIQNIAYNNYHYLTSLPSVTGIGLGFKHINGIATKEPCIHVLVEKKLNPNYLPCNKIIPKFYMGIKTDVMEIGVMELLSDDLKSKVRPIRGGYSVGSQYPDGKFTSGSITCVVKKTKLDKTEFFILGNNHILAGANKIPIGAKVIQPSKNDKGTLDDTIGTLEDFIEIKIKSLTYSPVNYVDCAIAKINNDLVSNMIGITGKLKGIGKANLGLEIVKVGKMSGLTKGVIKTIGTTIITPIDSKNSALFKKQIIAQIPIIKGDSGSPLLNNSNEILGLLMSGSTSKGTATFNDINLALKALNVELYTG